MYTNAKSLLGIAIVEVRNDVLGLKIGLIGVGILQIWDLNEEASPQCRHRMLCTVHYNQQSHLHVEVLTAQQNSAVIGVSFPWAFYL